MGVSIRTGVSEMCIKWESLPVAGATATIAAGYVCCYRMVQLVDNNR
jgi:hypothetical protein